MRNRAHLQKSTDKIFPREGPPQGIRPPQTCADRRTPARGHQEPPALAQLRHQLLPAACSQGLEQVSRSAELLIRLRPRRRKAASPPKWSVGSLCSSLPHSARQLPEQSRKYQQPPPYKDDCSAAVSDSPPFSADQAKAQSLRQRPGRLSADLAGQRRCQQEFAKHPRKKGANYRKKLLRPQHRTTTHLTSPTAASAKAYFWRCGLTRGRRRGVPQAAGANRNAQRPATHRALQKVVSVYTRPHPKDNMQC